MPKRILFDLEIFLLQKRGGINSFMNVLSDGLSENNQVEFFGLYGIIKTGKIEDKFQSKSIFNKLYIEFIRPLLVYILSHRYDLVIYSYYPWFINRNNSMVILHDIIHEQFKNNFKRSSWIIFKKHSALRRANTVVSISDFSKRRIQRYVNRDMLVIHHGFDVDMWPPNRVIMKTESFVLYVGSRHSYKNFKLAIDFVRDKNKVLWIIGGGKLHKQEELLLFESNVEWKFVEEVDNAYLAELYRRCEYLIYPSEYEGFGMPPVECLLCDGRVLVQPLEVYKEFLDLSPIVYEGVNGILLSASLKFPRDYYSKKRMIATYAEIAEHF